MKNLFILFLIAVSILGCDVTETPSASNEKVIIENIKEEKEEIEDDIVFSKVPVVDQPIFQDWIYIGNNSNVWINLDLAAKVGSDAEECIAVIRIESIDGAEIPEPTEWVNGEIRKPVPLLEPYSFNVFKDVRIYEVILWADEFGQLEVLFNFDWPYEKRQEVKVSFMAYAKTK